MNGCVYTACKQAHLHSHVASLGHSRCANRCAHVVTLYVASQGHCRTLSALPRGRAGHKLLANSHSHDAMRWHWDTSGTQTRMPVSPGNDAGKVCKQAFPCHQGGSAKTQQAHKHMCTYNHIKVLDVEVCKQACCPTMWRCWDTAHMQTTVPLHLPGTLNTTSTNRHARAMRTQWTQKVCKQPCILSGTRQVSKQVFCAARWPY